MLLFCTHMSMMIREITAHCKSAFSNLFLFIFSLIQHYVISIVILFEVITEFDMLTAL